MTSVITSSRVAAATVFDTVASTAGALNQLVGNASMAIDALSAKTGVFHYEVTTAAKLRMVSARDGLIVQAANDHCDFMEESHRKNYPGSTFDRTACFNDMLAKLDASLSQSEAQTKLHSVA